MGVEPGRECPVAIQSQRSNPLGHLHPLDGAQVGVFEKTDQVGLASLLQGHDGRALEAQIRLEVLSDFTDQALEGQLADEKLGALLVTADLAKSDRARPVTMGLLHSTSSRCTLAGGLGRQLLSRGLATGRFTCRLLCTRHCRLIRVETALNAREWLRPCGPRGGFTT